MPPALPLTPPWPPVAIVCTNAPVERYTSNWFAAVLELVTTNGLDVSSALRPLAAATSSPSALTNHTRFIVSSFPTAPRGDVLHITGAAEKIPWGSTEAA